MDRYTNLNLYGHLALELGSDNNSSGSLTNVPTSDISFLRFTGSNPIIHGLDPGHGANNNKILVMTFLGTGSLTFKHLSSSNSSNNFRIKTPNGEDYIVPINYGSILIYDSYDNFWHIVGEAKLAAGSNGEIQFNNNGSLKGSTNFSWDYNNSILNVNGTIYSTALFDNGKRVATLTGTETFQNKTLVSPTITGTLTFGNVPFYQYGHHGISIFEDFDLSNSNLQTVYNFGTPNSERSSVLSLSIKDQYRSFIGTTGTDALSIFTIGSTSNNTNFQIQKGTTIRPVDLVTGETETTLLFLTSEGQLRLPSNIPSTSHSTGTLVVSGGIGIGGEAYFKDNLHLLGTKSLRFYDDNFSNYVGIKGPTEITQNYIFSLPPNYGSNGQVLTTNGSGTLSFTTITQNHNSLTGIQGGGSGNYYHSNQPINTSSNVQFAGLNIGGNYSLPSNDGTNGQALVTNGSGTLTFTNITQVHNDLTSIQGGGGGNYYHSNQAINTTDSVIFNNLTTTSKIISQTDTLVSGILNVKGIKFPISDGTNGQVLQTDGNGNLSFITVNEAIGSVLDTYINTQKITINNSDTATIFSMFLETITGIYYFWISEDPRIKGTIAVNSSDLTNSTLETLSPSITWLQNNSSTLNVYTSSGNIVFQNNTGSSITLVVRRETTPAVGGSTGISTLTIGTGLSGGSYNGTNNVTIGIDSSVVTLTGSQVLSNKTLTSPILNGGSLGGDFDISGYSFTGGTLAGNKLFLDGATGLSIKSLRNGTILLQTSVDGGSTSRAWTFNSAGNIVFPDESTQGTGWSPSRTESLTNKTLVSPTITSLIVTGTTRMGSNTFTKNLGNGDISLDNGTTDTPGITFYHGNNINYGIDTFFDSGQRLRFVKNLNEAGGAELGYFDLNGNFTTAGYLNPSSYKPGQVIKDTMLSNTEITVVSTTIAATNSNVDFITYNYTPISASSYLIVHIHISKYINADVSTGNDSWFSVLKVAGNEIAYGYQRTLNAFRSGTLFPLTGRYTNSDTNAKTIAVAARRDTADDSFIIDNTSTAIWLRITEVAR